MITFIIILTIAVLIYGLMSKTNEPKIKYDYNIWFETTKESVDSILNFLADAQSNKKLCDFIESQTGAVLKLNGRMITSPIEKLENLLLMDLIKCYKIMEYDPAQADIRSIPIFLFYSKLKDSEVNITPENLEIFRKDCQESFISIMQQLSRSVSRSTDVFFIAEYLKHFDKELVTKYITVLMRFGYKVAGAKGKVSKQDESELDKIFNYIREV